MHDIDVKSVPKTPGTHLPRDMDMCRTPQFYFVICHSQLAEGNLPVGFEGICWPCAGHSFTELGASNTTLQVHD